MYVFPLPRKIMKKCSSKVLAMAMAVAMMVPEMNVMAATGTTDSTTESTTVKYEVTQGYEWTIHSEIDFGTSAGVSKTVERTGNTVSVTKNIIPDGKNLNITVAGSGANGEFQIENGNTVLSYTIKDGDTEISKGGVVLNVAAGTNTDSKDLTFTLSTTTETAEVAGSYTGTVTYTASIK